MSMLDLQGKSAAPEPPYREPATEHDVNPHRARALLYTTLGTILMVLGPIIGLALGFVISIFAVLPWLGITAAAAKLLQLGKRHRALGAAAVLDRDPRAPVLYLRSFGADEKTGERVGRALSIKGVDLTVPTTEEEQIAKVAGRVGPLIAIGRPNENLPMLGAARMYLADDQWQARVLDVLSRSSIVLMRAGKTEGFWWEVEQVVKHNRPEQLIWLVPFSAENFRIFAERANTLLPKPLPLDPGPQKYKVGSLRGWIWFEPDWTPHIEAPNYSESSGKGAPVACLMQRALSPIFLRIGEVNASLMNSGWRRAGAFCIDLAICSALFFVALAAESIGGKEVGDMAFWIWLALMAIYFIGFDLAGGTVGKRAMKLMVVDRTGEPLSSAHAVARGVTKCITIIPLPITVLYALFSLSWSTYRRMPHDQLTRTYVIDRAEVS